VISGQGAGLYMSNPLLSVIIISHNQREELRRCVESVLSQHIPFSYEIILSDDRSDDGTYELAKEYEARYPGIVVATQCNSDECNPANNSQRSGWNRCNGYKLARGKYIAHVDGDDYFRPGSRVLERQVAMLEAHPECSLCMENVLVVGEGQELELGVKWRKETFFDGRIITPAEYIGRDLFILNQAFVQRRNLDVDPVALYGKHYVDTVITYHHLQFGNIVCVDACDYVYVKHPGAVTTTMKRGDTEVIWNVPVYITSLIPSLAGLFIRYQSDEFLMMIHLVRWGHQISESALLSIADIDAFMYRCLNRKLTYCEERRLSVAKKLLALQNAKRVDSVMLRRLIYRLVIRANISASTSFRL